MPLTLSTVPGFSDLPDSVLAAEQNALGVHLGRIASNAAFGMVRLEVFSGVYHDGDTVILPTSSVDGYNYQRSELLYLWAPLNTGNGSTNWATDGPPWTMWYAAFNVNQTTGKVSCAVGYRGNQDHTDRQNNTKDGNLQVWTIAQRGLTTLTMAAVPSYVDHADAAFYTDRAANQSLVQEMNRAAKYGVSNTEVIYMGVFANGNQVPTPVSPIDGYAYSYGEVSFQTCLFWTADDDGGSPANMVIPAISEGQLDDWSYSVNPTTGIVTMSVAYESFGTHTYHKGRVAVFAFCNRYNAIVPGTAQVWDPTLAGNAALPIGHDGSAAVVILRDLTAGSNVTLKATGLVTEGGSINPEVTHGGGATSGSLGVPPYTLTLTGTAPVKVGDTIVVCAQFHHYLPIDAPTKDFGPSGFTVSDNLGNTYVPGPSFGADPGVNGAYQIAAMFVCISSIGAGTPTVAVTTTGLGDPTHGYGASALFDAEFVAFTGVNAVAVDNSNTFGASVATFGAYDFIVEMNLNTNVQTSGFTGAGQDMTDFAVGWKANVGAGIVSLPGNAGAIALLCAPPLLGTYAPQGGNYGTDTIPGSPSKFPLEWVPGATMSTLGFNGLMGAFTDSAGVVKGNPIVVSTGGTFTVPAGATQLQLGINDNILSDNGGSFRVSVQPMLAAPNPTFTEIDAAKFYPGATLRASIMQQMQHNIRSAVVVPEFFGPTHYTDGQTIPLPVSPIDGYAYSRSELIYIWDWADTGPTITSYRMVMSSGSIDASGTVHCVQYRFPSGASNWSAIHEGTMNVIVVAKRNIVVTLPAAPISQPVAGSVSDDASGFFLINGT